MSRNKQSTEIARVSKELAKLILPQAVHDPTFMLFSREVPLCFSCVGMALITWQTSTSQYHASFGCREQCVPDSNRFTLEFAAPSDFGRRTLMFEVADMKTLNLVEAQVHYVRKMLVSEMVQSVGFEHFQQLVTSFFTAPSCAGLSVLHADLDVRELCEGYSDEGAQSHSFVAARGNIVSFSLGDVSFVAACVNDSSNPRQWKVFSSDCRQLCESDGSVCSVCRSALRSAKDSIGRLAARSRSIRADPAEFCSEKRFGEGTIRKLFMSELQLMCSTLYLDSSFRDGKYSYRPRRNGSNPQPQHPKADENLFASSGSSHLEHIRSMNLAALFGNNPANH